MSIEIQWLNHASFRIAGSQVMYVDPWKIGAPLRDGQAAVISHAHFDHCSPEDVRKVLADDGAVVAPPDVLPKLGLPSAKPTYVNSSHVMSWSNLANLKEVSIYAGEDGAVSSILICVETEQAA